MRPVLRPLLAALLLANAFAARAAPVLSLTPTSQQVVLGSQVTLDLGVSGLGTTILGAFDVLVTFDPALLSPNNAVFDTYLGDPDASLAEAFTDFDTSTAGQIELVDISVLSSSDLGSLQLNSFPLAQLVFNTIGTGVTTLSIVIQSLADGDANELVADTAGAEVQVTPPAGVPEPGTLLLVGLGLASLAGLKRC